MSNTQKPVLQVLTLKTEYPDVTSPITGNVAKKPKSHYGNLILAFSKEQALGTYLKVLSDMKRDLKPEEYKKQIENNSIVKIGEYHPTEGMKLIHTKEELYFTLEKIDKTITTLKKETK